MQIFFIFLGLLVSINLFSEVIPYSGTAKMLATISKMSNEEVASNATIVTYFNLGIDSVFLKTLHEKYTQNESMPKEGDYYTYINDSAMATMGDGSSEKLIGFKKILTIKEIMQGDLIAIKHLDSCNDEGFECRGNVSVIASRPEEMLVRKGRVYKNGVTCDEWKVRVIDFTNTPHGDERVGRLHRSDVPEDRDTRILGKKRQRIGLGSGTMILCANPKDGTIVGHRWSFNASPIGYVNASGTNYSDRVAIRSVAVGRLVISTNDVATVKKEVAAPTIVAVTTSSKAVNSINEKIKNVLLDLNTKSTPNKAELIKFSDTSFAVLSDGKRIGSPTINVPIGKSSIYAKDQSFVQMLLSLSIDNLDVPFFFNGLIGKLNGSILDFDKLLLSGGKYALLNKSDKREFGLVPVKFSDVEAGDFVVINYQVNAQNACENGTNSTAQGLLAFVYEAPKKISANAYRLLVADTLNSVTHGKSDSRSLQSTPQNGFGVGPLVIETDKKNSVLAYSFSDESDSKRCPTNVRRVQFGRFIGR